MTPMRPLDDKVTVRAARQVVERLNDPDTGSGYEQWVAGARGCEQPVRLVGSSSDVDGETGEVVRQFSTEAEPDGVLLKPCGNRRARVRPVL